MPFKLGINPLFIYLINVLVEVDTPNQVANSSRDVCTLDPRNKKKDSLLRVGFFLVAKKWQTLSERKFDVAKRGHIGKKYFGA